MPQAFIIIKYQFEFYKTLKVLLFFRPPGEVMVLKKNTASQLHIQTNIFHSHNKKCIKKT